MSGILSVTPVTSRVLSMESVEFMSMIHSEISPYILDEAIVIGLLEKVGGLQE